MSPVIQTGVRYKVKTMGTGKGDFPNESTSTVTRTRGTRSWGGKNTISHPTNKVVGGGESLLLQFQATSIGGVAEPLLCFGPPLESLQVTFVCGQSLPQVPVLLPQLLCSAYPAGSKAEFGPRVSVSETWVWVSAHLCQAQLPPDPVPFPRKQPLPGPTGAEMGRGRSEGFWGKRCDAVEAAALGFLVLR